MPCRRVWTVRDQKLDEVEKETELDDGNDALSNDQIDIKCQEAVGSFANIESTGVVCDDLLTRSRQAGSSRDATFAEVPEPVSPEKPEPPLPAPVAGPSPVPVPEQPQDQGPYIQYIDRLSK